MIRGYFATIRTRRRPGLVMEERTGRLLLLEPDEADALHLPS